MTIEDQTQTTGADSVTGTTDTQVTTEQTETPVTGAPEPATQEGSEESNFFDPNSVPEELKGAYKQMQAAFTKKTQEIAQARKEADSIKGQAEAYKKYQQYIPIVEQMLANQKPVTPELEMLKQQYKAAGYDDQSIEFMTRGIEFVLGHMNQTQETSRISSQIGEAAKVDPRLSDKSLQYQTDDGETVTYGAIVEEIVAADPNWKADPVAATRRAIKKVDALIGKSKTDGKQELSNLAKTKAQKFPATRTSPQGTAPSGQAMSFRDAFKKAQAETGLTLKQ